MGTGPERHRDSRQGQLSRAVHLASPLRLGVLLRIIFVAELWMLCARILLGLAEIVWSAVYLALSLLAFWAFNRGLIPLGMLGGIAAVAMLVLRQRAMNALIGTRDTSRKPVPTGKGAAKPL